MQISEELILNNTQESSIKSPINLNKNSHSPQTKTIY